MSLFKVRDWWSTQCGGDEDFDNNSLCTCNIDNNPNGIDKIIVGSHSGILRIFAINTHTNDDGNLVGCQPCDLLLEIDLKMSILQIASGSFLSATDKVHLAVLHSKKLSVYSISATAGVTEHGSSYNILLIYEHNLHRSAHSLVIGPFGQVKGRDFLCVQSLDGNLTFYEQESLAFSRFLPNMLLPGPLAYLPHSDSFIVATSTWTIESFRYQVLAIAKNSGENDNEKQSKGRKVTSDWSVIIGEAVIDIKVVTLEKLTCYILVLGERNMYSLKENGTIWFMKKFDFNPSCICVYPNEANDSVISLVATHVLTMLIYSNDILRWATQLPFTPVAIQRANVLNLQGLLVCLSSDGMLCCGYLGTNPSLNIVSVSEPPINITNYSQTEAELQELRKIINTINMDGHGAIGTNSLGHKNSTEDSIIINVSDLQTLSAINDNYINDKSSTPLLKLSITLESPININNLRLTSELPKSLKAEPSVVTIPSIVCNSEATTIEIIIWKEYVALSPSTNIVFIAAYSTEHGAPRIVTKSVHLPLNVYAKLTAPTKEADNILSFDITNNGQNIHLSELFSDLYDSSQNSIIMGSSNNGSSIGIEIYGDHNIVTIMTTVKSTHQRFRIHSDSYGAFAFIANELIRRLKRNDVEFDTSKMDKSHLSLSEVFSLIDKHMSARMEVKNLQNFLANCAAQFRAIQKRILIKLKDRNPTPLNNLDSLLKVAHSQIIGVGERLAKAMQELDTISSYLSASISLTCTLLLLISTEMKYDSQNIIKALFQHHISSDVEEGWEERTEVALITLLNNQSKDLSDLAKFTNSDFTIPENTDNLKKYINLIIDRLFQGDSFNQKELTSHKNYIKKSEAILEEDEDSELTMVQSDSNLQFIANSINAVS